MTMTNRIRTLIFGAAVLILTFSLGYLVGNQSKKTPFKTNNALSSKEMEHAFGNIAPISHEPEHIGGQEPMVTSLGNLVTGLEKKVAINPENIEQRLLLAQTYNELGGREKSLKLLRALSNQFPKNPQIKTTLATVLMKSSDKQELKEASKAFDDAIKFDPEAASMARMYQGEIRVKLDNLSK